MDPITPDRMIENINDLPTLIQSKTMVFEELVKKVLGRINLPVIRKVFIVGDGDSFHAGLSAEMAFESLAGTSCEVASAQKFLDYKAPYLSEADHDKTLIICISASGGTKRVLQSVKIAKEKGYRVFGMTGIPNSAIATEMDFNITLEVPHFPPCPGIRSYVATVLGLILTAVNIGVINKKFTSDRAFELIKEIQDLSNIAKSTIAASDKVACSFAQDIRQAGAMIFLGSGPSYGTAVFSAAKIIEACGIYAMGQDLEEWSHVEFFAYPNDMPTVIIAPPGNSKWRAEEIVEMVRSFGHKTATIAEGNDHSVMQNAHYAFPVVGTVREEFSPIIYHIGADMLAFHLANALNRKLFQSDNIEFQRLNHAYYKRDSIR